MELLPFKQGAEARLYTSSFYGKPCIVKERFSKSYRHPKLDKSLTTQRIKAEVRAMLRCRTFGIPTPTVYFVNLENNSIYMEHMKDAVTLRQYIEDIQLQHPETFIEVLTPLAGVVGKLLAKMHSNNIVHGDLTTSNMLLQEAAENSVLVLIDFGLSYGATLAEDKGVDLYVLERALLSTHPNTECLFETILISYKAEYKNGAADVISKLDEIRLRGRKRTMVG
ncbi:EKC/KEOPS complex subunit TP53RK-like [Gigantopelta aegis]|uniref:EKC/KEOPS complex subunit TP53RK-like n=1 Tax=Gigantopelta aegis TaxID=1735272 RepID=UPI001B88A292|nr:EKC/KEOPS complex subunit TP53RK-like [Gigantopelta aegis]